jgi:hypothetical protein
MRIFAIITCLISITLCQQGLNFTNNMTIAIEAGFVRNMYLAVEGDECLTLQQGKCGVAFGLNLPLSNITTANISDVLAQRPEIQFSLVQSQDFFCLRSVKLNSFLMLEGPDCSNITTKRECGRVVLNKVQGDNCTQAYGWRFKYIQNYYVLQSAQYPNVFFYFSAEKCLQAGGINAPRNDDGPDAARNFYSFNLPDTRACGNLVGFFLNDVENLQANVANNWAYLNIYPIGSNLGASNITNTTIPAGNITSTISASNITSTASASNVTSTGASNNMTSASSNTTSTTAGNLRNSVGH